MIAPLRETHIESTDAALDRARRWAAKLLLRLPEEETAPKIARLRAWLFIGWVSAVFFGYVFAVGWLVLAN